MFSAMSKQDTFLLIAIPTLLIFIPALVACIASLITKAAQDEVAESRRFRLVPK